MAAVSDREPTDQELDERYVLDGDPEEALRQLMNSGLEPARHSDADDEKV